MAKQYLTPTEQDIALAREELGPVADFLIGNGMHYAGAMRDLYKSNIEGNPRFDRDWEFEDFAPILFDAPMVAPLKTAGLLGRGVDLAAPALNPLLRGLTKGYNTLTGANRGAVQIGKPKLTKAAKDIQKNKGAAATPAPAQGGKGEVVPFKNSLEKAKAKPKAQGSTKKDLDNPAGATKGGKVIQAIKNNKGKTALGLGAAGVAANSMLQTANESEEAAQKDPYRPLDEVDSTVEGEGKKTLDQPATPAQKGLGMIQAAEAAAARGDKALGDKLRKAGNALIDADLENQVRDAKTQAGTERKNDFMSEAWRRSKTGKESGVDWMDLSPEDRAMYSERFRKANYYNSSDEAKKKRQAELTEKLKATGSYGVGNIGGGMTEEEFMARSGMQNPGTMMINNPDGTFTTGESGEAFERAGGRDSAFNVFDELGDNGAKAQMLHHQLAGSKGREVTGVDQQGNVLNLENLSPGSVRMSSDDLSYGDARFDSRGDALAYLNRKPVSEEAPVTLPDEESDDGFDFPGKEYLPLAAMLLSRGKIKPGVKSINTPALGNKVPGLPYSAQKRLPYKNNFNGGLPQKSMTGEQYRRAQTGMDPSGRVIGSQGRISNSPMSNISTAAGPNSRTPQGRFRSREEQEEYLRGLNKGIF